MSDTDRLRELEDREAIRQIFVDYGTYLDSGDHAGYASLSVRTACSSLSSARRSGRRRSRRSSTRPSAPTARRSPAGDPRDEQPADRPGRGHGHHRGRVVLPDQRCRRLPDGAAGRPLHRRPRPRERPVGHPAPRHLARDGSLAVGQPTEHTARRAGGPRAGSGGPRGDLDADDDVQAPPRPARLQVLLDAVHRRRGVGRQPRAGRRAGRDRGPADPHHGRVRGRSHAHLTTS